MTGTINHSTVTQCPICKSNTVNQYCTKQDAEYLQCSDCKHAFLTSLKNNSAYTQFYQDRTSHHASNTKVTWDYSTEKYNYVYKPLLSRLSRFIHSGRLLDIGCSNGSFVKAASNFGWEAVGIELEKASADLAASHDNVVINKDLKSANLPDNSLDCVTMWQLIEHLSDLDEILNEIYRILRPGGVLAISTPNNHSIAWSLLGKRWRAVDPAVHLHLFNAKSLTHLLAAHGFENRWKASYDIKPSTISDFLNTKKASNPTKSKNTSVADYTSRSSNLKLAFMFNTLNLINGPLNWLNLGEDIYMIVSKSS